MWKESAFRKLILFLVLTMGVRIVFTLQFLVMPKYYVRTLYDDFAIGSINAINRPSSSPASSCSFRCWDASPPSAS